MPQITTSYIGAMCREFRRLKLKGVTQQKIADDTGYSRELVSKFERGNTDNIAIFFWYIKHGLFDWIPVNRWNGWDLGL